MQLVTYINDGQHQLAVLVNGNLYNTDFLHPDLPLSMSMFLNYWEDMVPVAKAAVQRIQDGSGRTIASLPFADAQVVAPVPHPNSCRDGYAFRQHVAAARQR